MNRENPGADRDAVTVERLVFECLERIEDDGEGAVDRICAANPALADQVRTALARLTRLGLSTAVAEAEPGPAVPERLGDFRLERRLGAGGMGVVYLAEQLSLSRRVALKLIRPELHFFPGSRERFRREAEAIGRLQHPGIVAVHALGEEGGVPYLAMDYVEGASLASALAALEGREARMLTGDDLGAIVRAQVGDDTGGVASPWRDSWARICVGLVRQAADALDHAHSRGVVHRDVKPSNLFLTATGRVLLGDFGLAVHEGASRLTRSGDEPGSLAYMAPERLRGEGRDDPRQDIYALGVSLYEMLTLSLPFKGEEAAETRARVLEGRAVSPRRLNPAIPQDVETVCLVAMDRDPGRRYRNAADLARDLGHVLDGRPIEARRPGPLLRVRRWARRHPTLTLALFLLCIVGPVVFGWRESLARRQSERSAERTRRERDLKDEALREVRRLSDAVEVDDLLDAAKSLWPAAPEKIRGPDGFDAWIARADGILGRVPLHVKTLERVRRRARARPAKASAVAEGLIALRALAAERRGVRRAAEPGRRKRLAELDARLEEDRRRLLGADGWRFAEGADRWLHEELAELIASTLELEDVLDDVRRRRDFAGRVEERTIVAHRAAWDRAVAGIADRTRYPHYRGLALSPQRGLVPLGPDPDSDLFEFALLATGDVPTRDRATGALRVIARTGLVLVLLPGGTFLMGADAAAGGAGSQADPHARPREMPAHEVTLAPFFMSKYEMTQAQWIRATGDNPAFYGDGILIGGRYADSSHPVEQVSWHDAGRVLERLELALPTEAQWEYACRGGTSSVWWSGGERSSLEGAANLADAYARENGGDPALRYEAWLDDGWTFHAPVGTFDPNPFGLHDMVGNVWEWCRDVMLRYHVPARPGDGLRHVDDLSQVLMVIRGGSFSDDAGHARSAARNNTAPRNASYSLGVRPARRIL